MLNRTIDYLSQSWHQILGVDGSADDTAFRSYRKTPIYYALDFLTEYRYYKKKCRLLVFVFVRYLLLSKSFRGCFTLSGLKELWRMYFSSIFRLNDSRLFY